jgi:ATP-dependent Zn protease
LGRWGYFFAGFVSAIALLLALLALAPLIPPTMPIGGTGFIAAPTYNELLDKINDGSMAHASIRGNVVTAKTKAGQILQVWVFSPEKMAEKMVEKGIRVHTAGEDVSPPSLLSVLINWLPFIVFVLAFWFAMAVPLYGIRATLRRLEQIAKKE